MNQLLKTTCIAFLLALPSAQAAGLGGASFQLVPASRMIPERGKVPSMILRAADHNYSFLLPSDWRIGANAAEKKIAMQSRDYGATLEVRFISPDDGQPVIFSADKIREQLLARSDQTRLVKEYEWTTRIGSGLAFEVEKLTDDRKHRVVTRSIFVMHDGQVLEFTVTARPDSFPKYQRGFETLIASFRSE